MAVGFIFDFQKCTECERCMADCAVIKTGRVQLRESMIVIEKRWPEVPAIRVCRFDDCDGHPCIAACPAQAISERDGFVLIDREVCTGCEACVPECPYGAIYMIEGTARKCDFCAGDPACTRACVTAAISNKGG